MPPAEPARLAAGWAGLADPPGPVLRTWPELIAARVTEVGHREFLRFESERIGLDELVRLGNRFANALLAAGLRPGDRVAIWMRNRPEYVAALLGAFSAGLVAVTLDAAARAVDGAYLLADAGARAVLLGPETVETFRRARADLPEPPVAVLAAPAADGPEPGLADFLAGVPDERPDVAPPTPDAPAAIIYTSGTTGRPKGVVLPQGAYLNTARWYGHHVVAAGADDVFFTCLPLHHCNAQIFTLATALHQRSRIAMVQTFSASRYFDQIRAAGATVFNFIGMMLVAISKQPPRPDDRDNPARCGFGIPVPAELGAEFERRFDVALLEGYGATETGCGFAFNTVGARRLGWAGRAMPYAELKVVGDDGEPAPPGTVGRIMMRPREPHIWMKEYQGKPEQTARAWVDGWLHLDDFGVLDEAGWLGYRGRGLDWVRRRGENISAIEIEDICDRYPGVAKSAVVGVPSELTEEEVKLVVEWQPGAVPDPAGLVEWLARRLAPYKLPSYVQTVSAMPRTATGKLAKARLDRTATADWGVAAEGRVR